MAGATYIPTGASIGLYVELTSEEGNVLIPYRNAMELLQVVKDMADNGDLNDLKKMPDTPARKVPPVIDTSKRH